MYEYGEMIDRLKIILSERNISVVQLSNITGVPYRTIYKIISKETKEPSVNIMIKIASALEITTDFLIFGKQPALMFQTDTEKYLINIFRELNSSGQTKLVEYGEDLVASKKYEKLDSISEKAN